MSPVQSESSSGPDIRSGFSRTDDQVRSSGGKLSNSGYVFSHHPGVPTAKVPGNRSTPEPPSNFLILSRSRCWDQAKYFGQDDQLVRVGDSVRTFNTDLSSQKIDHPFVGLCCIVDGL